MIQDLRCTYDDVNDMWIVDTDAVLTKSMLEYLRVRVFKENEGRRPQMKSVDAKQHLEKALEALRRGRIQQRLSGPGDQVLFQSTERTRPDRTFSFGGK